MIKPINQDKNFLAIPAERATKDDMLTVRDLIDTLVAHQDNCVGMAANMIGVNKRIIICQIGLLPVIMINPVITSKSNAYQTKEGCLSLTGQRHTTRYENIEVTYENQNFNKQRQAFKGWIAQIIQHEVDHCDGIII